LGSGKKTKSAQQKKGHVSVKYVNSTTSRTRQGGGFRHSWTQKRKKVGKEKVGTKTKKRVRGGKVSFRNN